LPWVFACALAASNSVHAQAAPAAYQIVDDSCQPQKPRFPARYANFRALRGAAATERGYRVALATKDAQAHLAIEAEIQEIDLNGDGICDQIVIASDPIGTGGDHVVLATIYIARKGHWQRIGAHPTAKSDAPAYLDTMRSPKDQPFVFGALEALRRPREARTFLVVWTADQRVSNGFYGYRILEVDQAAGRLVPVDKWNDEGALIYADFKRAADVQGHAIFDAEIEGTELRFGCASPDAANAGMRAACERRPH